MKETLIAELRYIAQHPPELSEYGKKVVREKLKEGKRAGDFFLGRT